MTTNLTLVAALPGSGGGCMSALPAEVNEANKPEPTVQMKAAYFEETMGIDWSGFDFSGLTGGFGC
jgi:hypothetical protein